VNSGHRVKEGKKKNGDRMEFERDFQALVRPDVGGGNLALLIHEERRKHRGNGRSRDVENREEVFTLSGKPQQG